MTKRWTRDQVLDISRGYQASSVLTAAVELNLFGVLAAGPLEARAVATRLGVDPRGVSILLDALSALEFLDKSQNLYSVPPDLAGLLTTSQPESIVAMLRHQANCHRRWVQLAQVVRSGRPVERRPSIRGQAADQDAFIGAMHEISGPLAAPLVRDIGPPSFQHLLDIGGASGTWTIAFLEANPKASATIFDLPEVIRLARPRIAEAGLADRVTLAEGDFDTDELPAGADLAWVSAIVHQNSREQNRALFAKIHEALADGGRILVRDIVMDETRTQPGSGALFTLHMLVSTEGGGTFTLEELAEDLRASGFTDPALVRRGQHMDSVIGATKQTG